MNQVILKNKHSLLLRAWVLLPFFYLNIFNIELMYHIFNVNIIIFCHHLMVHCSVCVIIR